MVKTIRLFFAFLVLHLISVGCASPPTDSHDGYVDIQNFERYVPTREEIRNLTEAKLIEIIGEPLSREETDTSDGKRASTLSYFYMDSTAETDGRSDIAYRAAHYTFKEGVYSYSDSTSSFKNDSTSFEVGYAKLIELGDSYAKVVELLGEPSGMTAASGGDARDSYGSFYSYRRGTIPYVKGKPNEAVIFFFDANDTVTTIWSPNGTIPNRRAK